MAWRSCTPCWPVALLLIRSEIIPPGPTLIPPPLHLHCNRTLHYNLALKSLVIDAFIPHEEVSKVGRTTDRRAAQYHARRLGSLAKAPWIGLCRSGPCCTVCTPGTARAVALLLPIAIPPHSPPLQLMRRMSYDSKEATWTLRSSLDSAGVAGGRSGSAALPRRPGSAAPGRAGSAARRPSNVVLDLQLDIPERQIDLSNLHLALDAVTAQG